MDAQLTLISRQPHYIQSIPRYIKLLNADFKRTYRVRRTAMRHHHALGHSSPAVTSLSSSLPAHASSAPSTALRERLASVLMRLAPPTRLCPLAWGFQSTFEGVMNELRHMHVAPEDLEKVSFLIDRWPPPKEFTHDARFRRWFLEDVGLPCARRSGGRESL